MYLVSVKEHYTSRDREGAVYAGRRLPYGRGSMFHMRISQRAIEMGGQPLIGRVQFTRMSL